MLDKKTASELSSNISWTLEKGSWIGHFAVTIIIGMFFTQILGKNKGLQLAIIVYNLVSFFFFHWIVGDPFSTENKGFTFWEQMSVHISVSSSLRFLALYPIFLFLLVNRLVEWSIALLIISLISLSLVVIPKLGFMHMKRVFGIRRYD